MEELQGRVTVAPPVLTTIVRQTTLEETGVNRLAPLPAKMRGLRAGAASKRASSSASPSKASRSRCMSSRSRACNVLKLGTAVQNAVTRALEEMVGMNVVAVDVHIDDVAPSRSPARE